MQFALGSAFVIRRNMPTTAGEQSLPGAKGEGNVIERFSWEPRYSVGKLLKPIAVEVPHELPVSTTFQLRVPMGFLILRTLLIAIHCFKNWGH